MELKWTPFHQKKNRKLLIVQQKNNSHLNVNLKPTRQKRKPVTLQNWADEFALYVNDEIIKQLIKSLKKCKEVKES